MQHHDGQLGRSRNFVDQFIDEQGYFTLSFLPEQYRKALSYCGSHSGKDVDKWQETGLTPAFTEDGVPYVAQAELVLVVKKQFCQTMAPESFIDEEAKKKWYPNEDYHDLYIGQIVEAYRAE